MVRYEELNERKKIFVDTFVATNNQSEACRAAGYKPTNGDRIMKTVRHIIDDMFDKAYEERKEDNIATANEIMTFWTVEMRNSGNQLKDRIKCSEMLAKYIMVEQTEEKDTKIQIELV